MQHGMKTFDVKLERADHVREQLQIALFPPAADKSLHEHDHAVASVLIPLPSEYVTGSVKWVNTGEPESLSLPTDVTFAINRLTDLVDEVNR